MKGDRSGPEGQGPRTGRGLGLCSGNDKPGYMSNEAPMGMGRGGGRGFRSASQIGDRLSAIEQKLDVLMNK